MYKKLRWNTTRTLHNPGKLSLDCEKYNTGLVLSRGAAKGFAHLGVFKALREKGIDTGHTEFSYYDIEKRNKMFDLGYNEAIKILAETEFKSQFDKTEFAK